MPSAVSPRPMTAPAVMIAPQSARMDRPPSVDQPGRSQAPQHPLEDGQYAAADDDHPAEDDQEAAAAAARPSAVLPPGAVVAHPAEKAALAQHRPAVTPAHGLPPRGIAARPPGLGSSSSPPRRGNAVLVE